MNLNLCGSINPKGQKFRSLILWVGHYPWGSLKGKFTINGSLEGSTVFQTLLTMILRNGILGVKLSLKYSTPIVLCPLYCLLCLQTFLVKTSLSRFWCQSFKIYNTKSKYENCCSTENKWLEFIKHILCYHMTGFEKCPLS